jgi:glycosyltransferase involved in cell wall biosynthesis
LITEGPKLSTNLLPITVVLAIKNEDTNLTKCLKALAAVAKVFIVDSQSTDRSCEIAETYGVEVIQFFYNGGYPKKRQWALDNLRIDTPWVLLLDADEVVPQELMDEIATVIESNDTHDAYLIVKGFHFMGRRFRFGGFSHAAVLLIRAGKAQFEHIFHESADAPDMEIHERLIVNGTIGTLKTPLIHEDFKGLEAYIARHNAYSTWESRIRYQYSTTNDWGTAAISGRLFGNAQERRRFLKAIAIRIPFESLLWFLYHFIFRLGFLEGRRGLIACKIRASYISQARAKLYELNIKSKAL